MELSHDIEALCNAVGHALALTLAHYGGLQVVKAGLHALGCRLHLVLSAEVADGKNLDFVIS